MTLFDCQLRRVLALALILLGLSGCVTPPAPPATVHVFVSASGLVSFSGERFGAEQLPARLAKYGASPSQEIRVHMADSHHKQLMAQIFNTLHKKGYLRVLFQDEPHGVSEIVGEPNSRTEIPEKTSTLSAPSAK